MVNKRLLEMKTYKCEETRKKEMHTRKTVHAVVCIPTMHRMKQARVRKDRGAAAPEKPTLVPELGGNIAPAPGTELLKPLQVPK